MGSTEQTRASSRETDRAIEETNHRAKLII